jgi:hypothetical protein
MEDFHQQMWKQKTAFAFNGTQPEFLRMEDGWKVFVVRGEQTRTEDGQSLKPRAVVLVVYIQHHPDKKSLVEKAADVSPADEKGDGSAKAKSLIGS